MLDGQGETAWWERDGLAGRLYGGIARGERMMIELRHLIYFEAVARHEHVSRAAQELAIAQPALSKQIGDLEQSLGGVALFERAGRNIRLTEAGEVFLRYTRVILAQLEAARSEMQDRAGARRGRVIVGAPPTVGVRLLPAALAEFHRRFPDVELHVRQGGTQTLVGFLDAGVVDMAVITLPVGRRELRVEPLFDEDLVVVVAANHPLAGRSEVAFAELGAESFLLYPTGYEMRDATLAACRRAGFTPRVVLDGGEMDMLLRLAEAGLGIALMPPLALGGERLVALRIADQSLRRTMALAVRDDRALAPVARALSRFLVEWLRT